uniref:Uncharacterized protein n=1 Tax=Arundo donax TaxID=35708 RepID=A0A0A9DJ65_ARUDO
MSGASLCCRIEYKVSVVLQYYVLLLDIENI